ncbi:MAG TPA: PilN domain-containing protein [Candidatus Bathyarchaeia archaeon]|nr:PilN domain-containing protein [Candidatus Bathyarchaeia archaeon]
MKIEINVLPDGQKETIKEEKKIGFMLKIVFSFVAVLLLTNAVLYMVQMVLGIEYQAAKKASEATQAKNIGKENQLKKNFQETNNQVSNFSKVSSTIANWDRVLARISILSPDGIRINQLSADGLQLKISGFSKTRDDFLSFQERLKQEGFQFPVNISNLVASENFNFDLQITIPQDYLTSK